VVRELAPRPRLHLLVPQRSDRDAHEPLHGVARTSEKLAHLVGLPLADHDPPPRVEARGGRPHQGDLAGHHPLAVDDGTPPEPLHLGVVRRSPDLDQVLLEHAVARVCNAKGELAVVREDDQSFGVVVEASDRIDLLRDLAAQQVDDRRPSLGVVRRRHHGGGLVQQDVAQPLGGAQPLAVDLHGVAREVSLVPECCGAPVDGDAAVADVLLGLPPGTHPRSRNQLLEAFKTHWSPAPRTARGPPAAVVRPGRPARSVPGNPSSSGTAKACPRPASCPPP
jgi:hypothetical protein